jgi:hypothetical protein
MHYTRRESMMEKGAELRIAGNAPPPGAEASAAARLQNAEAEQAIKALSAEIMNAYGLCRRLGADVAPKS